MATWRQGRQLVAERIRRGERPIAEVLDEASRRRRTRAGHCGVPVQGRRAAPPALVDNLRHNKVLHKTTLLLSVDGRRAARRAASASRHHDGARRLPGVLRFGFMEEPDVPAELARDGRDPAAPDRPRTTTYFIGRESVIAGKVPGCIRLEHLFVLLNRGADSASRFFNLPPDRVFEVGTQVEI